MHVNYPLSEYISLLEKEDLIQASFIRPEDRPRPVRCLTCNSQQAGPDTLFICKGVHFKKDYLVEAIARGAFLYICESPYEDVACSWIQVRNIRHAMAVLALCFFDHPSSRLDIIGITGTKGKSTTAYFLKAILDEAFPTECGILSTIENYDGVVREEAHLTTPETLDLQQHLSHAVDSRLSHLIMEVSSQALKYERVYGTRFHIACFLNIGADHISPAEHPDFEDYFSSKLKIFAQSQIACINHDAAFADRIADAARTAGCRLVTFGSAPECDVYCRDIEKRDSRTFFTVQTAAWTHTFELSMPGLFNVENALCAIAASLVLNIAPQDIAHGLLRSHAAGRMELYTSRNGHVTVIVDYAHNSMSFEALYRSVSVEHPDKKIVTVFGCPGGKALLRRHDLGLSAGRHSDFVIITEEDTGDEPFTQIADAIAAAVRTGGCAYTVIENRGQAIRSAILEHGENSVILITGKGTEAYQKRGAVFVPEPSDVDYAKQYLAEYDRFHPEA